MHLIGSVERNIISASSLHASTSPTRNIPTHNTRHNAQAMPFMFAMLHHQLLLISNERVHAHINASHILLLLC